MAPATARKQIRVRGIVQGIGFRPFVVRLARQFQLNGHVRNTAEGVLMEVEGAPGTIEQFLQGMAAEPPPFAQIEDTLVTELTPTGATGFAVQPSLDERAQFALVSPDLAMCAECRREVTDPRNRRFGYPFTNCTHCGPRYSIIREVPYDRPQTTMAGFRMCRACQAEYDDPENRRFHAQPNACPVCGPSLTVEPDAGAEPIPEAHRLLAAGHILAIKGLGGFQLACDAENDPAVRLLRQRKRRSDKPFALMAPDLAAIEEFCFVSDADRQALEGPQRPIVILPRRPDAPISPAVAPDNQTLGVMLPYTPLHNLLLAHSGGISFRALVMTSGNLSEEPLVTRNDEARERLSAIADGFLCHNRDIHTRVDDSVVRTFEGRPTLLRRARGYAPYPIDLGAERAEVLACGGQFKNTLCLTKGRYALLSQHLGDLENYETLEFFRETLERMKALFRVEPRAVIHDLHPDYLSTRFARELGGETIAVQHHHAHIASCMAENHLQGRVIGVAFDGTGFGTDGQIWGGEFLVADLTAFERLAHFRYVPLAGGDQAVREPWRMALSYLLDAFGAETAGLDLPLWAAVPARQRDVVRTMIRRGVNTVQTSSCGRLFDAVASLTGVRHEVTFEGQAAMQLETIAEPGIEASYDFEIGSGPPWQVDFRPAIRTLIADMQQRVPAAAISAKFHNTVADVIGYVCQRLRTAESLNRVCLSGGAFQNQYLLSRAVFQLRSRGFEVFLHCQVPPNDGGLSLGQAVIGAHLLKPKAPTRR
ncbi:MAG: carbamoyltransferase HypF [Acidobacteriia bacterium]|nr:carbamoyltransferase HypF [Terriglobia bacterium]